MEKLLEMGPNLQKLKKKTKQKKQKKTCQISRFLSEKNLWIWVGFSDLGHHTPSKNNLSTLLGVGNANLN